MTHTAPIQVESGDEVRGPHYRQWHSVIAPHTESTLLHAGHVVLGVRQGDVLCGITRYRQSACDTATELRPAVLDPVSLNHCGWLPDRDDWGAGIILTMRPDVAAGFAAVVIVGGVPTGIGQQSPTIKTVRTEAMGHRGAGSYIKWASRCESGRKGFERYLPICIICGTSEA